MKQGFSFKPWSARGPFPIRWVLVALAVGSILSAAVRSDERAFVRSPDAAELEWGPCPSFMPAGCAIARLQGNPAERNADILFRLPAGSSAPMHWHASAERMLLLSGEMRVSYEGQSPVVLEAGMYAYGPARRPHEAVCVSGDACVLFVAFEEPVDAFPAEAGTGPVGDQ